MTTSPDSAAASTSSAAPSSGPRNAPLTRGRGFHHVGLVSGNAPRTDAFYAALLGLSPLDEAARRALPVLPAAEAPDPEAAAQGPWGTPELAFATADGGPGSILAFRVARGGRKGRWGVGGIHHVALSVPDEAALLRWKRRLEDSGVRTTGPYDRGYFTSLYFQDPDGQVLELATDGPGYDIDEPADALGERFIAPPDTRVRGHRDEAAIAARTHPEPVDEIDEEMRIGHIHHVTGITDDLDAAHAFYTGEPGLRLVKQTANQDDAKTKHLFWAAYDGESVAPASAMTHFGWPGSDYRARPGVGQTGWVALVTPDGSGEVRLVEAPDGLPHLFVPAGWGG
jgi:glyoxalase family protein